MYFLNHNNILLLYYKERYKLPISRNAYYIYNNKCCCGLEYYNDGLWWVDVCCEESVRGKSAVKSFNLIRQFFTMLFYVKGYLGLISKDNKAARVNARLCGFRYFRDIEVKGEVKRLYIRSG